MNTLERDPAWAELQPPLSAEQAVVEAERCLECGAVYAEAPCVVACPAGIDVPAFVGALAAGDAERASELVFDANLLAGTCARVCPVEVLCEGACVLLHEGRSAVEVGRLQRFAADWGLAHGIAPRRRAAPNGRRVAVIGAGPAGLVCAGELAARGYTVDVYDERREPGGLVRFAIAPYRQRREPLPAETRLLADLGVRFHFETRIDCPAALRALEREADAVFLGVGMGPDVELGIPGDDLPGVWESLRFVEAIKTGHPPKVGRRAVVLGGGNTAVDMAREALRLGAEDVVLVYRRTDAEMPAYAHEVAEAREEGVRCEWLAAPARFLGTTRLEGVECVRMHLGEPDASGRRRPEPIPGSEFTLPCETGVKAIGQRARSELISWIDGLELERGRIAIDAETGRTANPKYFAAGDAVNGGATVVEAVRGAKAAARAIDAWLEGQAP
jgi:dihydropyrimidine dehydrogenase (NAD+) subunit PreT